MNVTMEHANMHVQDVDRMLAFIKCAFPSFRIRYDSGTDDSERWVHIGDDNTYLAIYRATQAKKERPQPYSGRPGINHIGFAVDDVESLRQRLLDGGYEETTVPNKHPARRRIYFNDPEGYDWEFIEYFSEDPEQRNDYALKSA